MMIGLPVSFCQRDLDADGLKKFSACSIHRASHFLTPLRTLNRTRDRISFSIDHLLRYTSLESPFVLTINGSVHDLQLIAEMS